MSSDAEKVLDVLLRCRHGRKARGIAMDLGWRHGANLGLKCRDRVSDPSPADADTHRVIAACKELARLGLATEKTSGGGSRWKPVR
jgi:hypothetical protein